LVQDGWKRLIKKGIWADLNFLVRPIPWNSCPGWGWKFWQRCCRFGNAAVDAAIDDAATALCAEADHGAADADADAGTDDDVNCCHLLIARETSSCPSFTRCTPLHVPVRRIISCILLVNTKNPNFPPTF
jgi:hypothetical protein